jgi:SAM-dependent methyltransferase
MTGAPAPAPSAARLEHVRCNLCDADRAAALFERYGHRVVRCTGCGLSYVDPRPDAAAITRMYLEESYYHNRNASAFGYPDYVGERAQLALLFAERLHDIERLRRVPGRLLDVGCAVGVLLEIARTRGWDAQGVDVSDFAVARCREQGFRVHHGDLASARFADESFDVAVLDDTIEHLPDPRAVIAELRRVLVPGGLLTMNTPNEAGWLRRLQGARWFHYKPPEHLYYFSPATLGRLLEESGFRVRGARTSGKVVTVRYLCWRMLRVSDRLGRALLATLGRLPGADRPFSLPIGQFVIFAERA